MSITPEERLQRLKMISALAADVSASHFALPEPMAKINQLFIKGLITHQERLMHFEQLYGLPVEEQLAREEAVRQSTAR